MEITEPPYYMIKINEHMEAIKKLWTPEARSIKYTLNMRSEEECEIVEKLKSIYESKGYAVNEDVFFERSIKCTLTIMTPKP